MNHSHRTKPRYRRRRQTRRRVYLPRRFLLTRNEAAFFRTLTALVGDRWVVSCKVRLADIITVSDHAWRHGAANRISQKHVDFVLSCPQSSRIFAAIELDDRSHQRPGRRRRDAFLDSLFSQLRVRLIRVPARWTYDSQFLGEKLAAAGLSLKEEIDPGSVSAKLLKPGCDPTS